MNIPQASKISYVGQIENLNKNPAKCTPSPFAYKPDTN